MSPWCLERAYGFLAACGMSWGDSLHGSVLWRRTCTLPAWQDFVATVFKYRHIRVSDIISGRAWGGEGFRTTGYRPPSDAGH